MKNLSVGIVFFFIFSPAFTQSITRATLNKLGTLENIILEINPNLVFIISGYGQIWDWDSDIAQKIEYYASYENNALIGKIKSIGGVSLKYYPSYDNDSCIGKIKSIGTVTFNYYASYENDAVSGKLKNIGNTSFTYYPTYANDAYIGKLKSINATSITWYATYDNDAYVGKLKSIGTSNFTWYASYDNDAYKGKLKYGSKSQVVDGIRLSIKFWKKQGSWTGFVRFAHSIYHAKIAELQRA